MMEAFQKARAEADHALYMARHYWAVPVLQLQAPDMHRKAALAYRKLADELDRYSESMTFPPTEAHP